MWQTSKNIEASKTWHTLVQPSLKLKGLAQARGFPRSGELLSTSRELEKRNSGAIAFSRLNDTSSPERDDFSLETGARRLNGNSRNSWGISDTLA